MELIHAAWAAPVEDLLDDTKLTFDEKTNQLEKDLAKFKDWAKHAKSKIPDAPPR